MNDISSSPHPGRILGRHFASYNAAPVAANLLMCQVDDLCTPLRMWAAKAIQAHIHLLPLAITITLCALTDAKRLNFGVTTVKETRFSCRCPEGFACTTPTSSYAIGAKWRSSVARPANPKRHPTTPRFSFDYFNLLTS